MVVMMDFLETDSGNLWAHMKKDEKRLVQKRRWLLGLPASHDKKQASKEPKFFQEITMPDSFLREDDLFIDKLKKAFDNFYTGRRSGKSNLKICNLSKSHIGSTQLITLLLSHLSEMTNTGLMDLTSTLTANPSQYIRTRTNMEKFIRNYLRELLKKHKSGSSDDDSIQKLSKFLRDCNNFENTKGLYHHRSILVKHDDVHRTLSNLEFATYHILDTMLRKLCGIMPYGGKRKHANLVYDVRHACLGMLVQGSDGEEDEYVIPDLLAMTMDCFIRSMQPLFRGGDGSSLAVKFYHFSPAKEALMDEIVLALHVMQKRMNFTKLDKLRHALGVDEGVSNRSVRSVIRDTLIDYLFNCGGDADTVPDSLIKFLNLTNGPHHELCSKNDTKEEVECVLNVGASMKQILWDSLLDHDIDQDFADAFMEDLEDSDDGEFECRWVVHDSNKTEISNLCSISVNEFADDMVDVKPFQGVDMRHQCTKSVDDDTQITHGNEYLDVQDVCDNVSAVTYSLIGCLLDRYGKKESSDFCVNTRSYLKHDILTDRDIEVTEDERCFNEEGDYIFHLVKTLIPEFPESGLMKLDELMKI